MVILFAKVKKVEKKKMKPSTSKKNYIKCQVKN